MSAAIALIYAAARRVGALSIPLALAAGAPRYEQAPARQPAQQAVQGAAASSTRVVRNPRKLTAVELLEPTHPGAVPHVRFEWDQVPDARGYVLVGRWATAAGWTMQSREFRVTPRVATAWERDRVVFDAALPEGSHSWNLVALFGPNDEGDFDNPTLLSFELR